MTSWLYLQRYTININMLRFNYLLHVLTLHRRGVSNFSLCSVRQRETEIGCVFFCVLTIMKVTYAFSIDHNDDCV